ncbi:MAG: Kelch repeat-containing protein [Woeseiaceae bacterium]
MMKSKGILVVLGVLACLFGCGGSGNGGITQQGGAGGPAAGAIWQALTPMPTARLEFATASAEGLIYVIGGRDSAVPVTPKPLLATVDVYDRASDTWSSAPDLPIALAGLMAVGVDDKIYVMGGEQTDAMVSKALFEFDPATQIWRQLADLPLASHFSAHAAVAGQIFVAGGANAGFQVADLYRYDLATDTWTVGAPMGNPREGARGVNMNGQFLVHGGKTATHAQDAGYRRVLESYEPITDIWTSVEPGEPRGDFGIAAFDGLAFMFGGSNVARTLDWVHAYDPVADTWITKTALPKELGFTAAEVSGDEILVFSAEDTFSYRPANDP